MYFKFHGGKAGDTIKISWVDNKGEHDAQTFTVK
ncbi:MAG: thiosulfate oxidation carrier complex protein SoxZ [Gammaproteobacteria bacterium]